MGQVAFTIGMICIANFPCVKQKWYADPHQYPSKAICESSKAYLPVSPKDTAWICTQSVARSLYEDAE